MSCYFTYGPNLELYEDTFENVMMEYGWTLQCTVCVQDTADSTYFCVVGWGPGGYSGIKQVDSDTRLAIFSMWNDEEMHLEVSITLLLSPQQLHFTLI